MVSRHLQAMNQKEKTNKSDSIKEELKTNNLCLSNAKKNLVKYSLKKTNKIK